MKRILLIVSILLSIGQASRAQLTVAYDFTLIDTDGQEFNLYETLDAGYTVLIDFFFVGCAPCGPASTDVEIIYGQYIEEQDECLKIIGLHVSDYESVATLVNYKTTKGLDYPVFHHATNDDHPDYDGPYFIMLEFTGHINVPRAALILPDHSITYNELYSGSAVRDAIDAALPETSCHGFQASVDEESGQELFTIYPNPFSDQMLVTNETGFHSSVIVSDVLGKTWSTFELANGENQSISEDLPDGVYLVTIQYSNGLSEVRKIVRQG